jgi:hypothetical protein
VLLASILTWSGIATVVDQLDGVDIDVTQVADSGSYFVYSYSITNPVTSAWAISAVKVDIAASSGTPPNLPATGELLDATENRPGDSHAEVGPITPTGWKASLTRAAELWWYPPSTGLSTSDSIAPGQTKGGFGIRSSYLPGIHAIAAEPTVESCCLEVAPGADGPWYPRRADFAVIGYAVVPRYQPSEVSIGLLQSQLTAVCDDPLWLDHPSLCTEFGDLLDAAAHDYGDSNFYGAAAVLNHLLDRIGDEEAAFDANGYWLMSLNVQQAYENVQAVAESAAFLFHFRTIPDTIVAPDGRVMSGSSEAVGEVDGSIAASTSKTFYWVRDLDSGYTIADGTWAVQLDLFELELEGGDLSLRDIQIQRYSSSGTLLESKYLHQGEVMSLPTGRYESRSR